MKRIEKWVWVSGIFLLGLSSTIALRHESDGPSKKQRWGLELALCQQALAKNVPDKCKLYGKIQFVDHFPDVKVQIVDHFPDIKIKKVNNFPNKPGLWKIVDHFPDYKVQIVDHFPDYKIEYVKHFPGCD
jgi:hypothetical protein